MIRPRAKLRLMFSQATSLCKFFRSIKCPITWRFLSYRSFSETGSFLNLSSSPCCGLEWLLCNGPSGNLASNGLVCLDQSNQLSYLSRSTVACGTSICQCKKQQNALTGGCLGLENYTVGIDGVCANSSCPAGYRLFHTGSSFMCDGELCTLDGCLTISLFESSCQGLVVIYL